MDLPYLAHPPDAAREQRESAGLIAKSGLTRRATQAQRGQLSRLRHGMLISAPDDRGKIAGRLPKE